MFNVLKKKIDQSIIVKIVGSFTRNSLESSLESHTAKFGGKPCVGKHTQAHLKQWTLSTAQPPVNAGQRANFVLFFLTLITISFLFLVFRVLLLLGHQAVRLCIPCVKGRADCILCWTVWVCVQGWGDVVLGIGQNQFLKALGYEGGKGNRTAISQTGPSLLCRDGLTSSCFEAAQNC